MPTQEKLYEGMQVEVTCDRLHASGAGITTWGEYDIFVAGALPAAHLKVQVDHVSPHAKNHRRQAWAHILNTIAVSPHAQTPFCPAFGACGGCTWQDLAYEQQLLWKQQLVTEALSEVQLPSAVAACVASPFVRAYRNQAKYVVEVQVQGLRLGGYAPRSHTVVDLSECALVEPAIASTLPQVRALLGPVGSHLRHIVLRANAEQEVLATLVFGACDVAKSQASRGLGERLLETSPRLVGVVANVNEAPGDVIFGKEEFTLAGQGFLHDQILGASVRLSPRAFFQVNRHVAALAYGQIVEFAKSLREVRNVWDVYAGVGTIARVLCAELRAVETALCVEVRSAAVADAQSFVKANGREPRLRFVAADAAVGIPDEAAQPDLVVVNPPRAGCHPAVLSRLASARPKGVAYLSCNPTTLARDLVLLKKLGLVARRVQPFDMLPHTPHVETLALLVPDS